MLQNTLINKLIEGTILGKRIRNNKEVSEKGKYALDATEKNPNIEGTIAEDVTKANNAITNIKNTINKLIALPSGESTAADAEIAAAKIGPKGEQYDTLQDSISKQIEDYKGVSVSNTQPSVDSEVDVWVNTNENEDDEGSISIPEIDDDNVSEYDTWSSSKINEEIVSLSESVNDIKENRVTLTAPNGDKFVIGVDNNGGLITTRL